MLRSELLAPLSYLIAFDNLFDIIPSKWSRSKHDALCWYDVYIDLFITVAADGSVQSFSEMMGAALNFHKPGNNLNMKIVKLWSM